MSLMDLEPNAKREFRFQTADESGNWDWFASLKPNDLKVLRAAVRRVHMRHFPADNQTDYEADRIIATLGPEVGEKMLKRAIDRKIVT